jgi:hypothetical protein
LRLKHMSRNSLELINIDTGGRDVSTSGFLLFEQNRFPFPPPKQPCWWISSDLVLFLREFAWQQLEYIHHDDLCSRFNNFWKPVRNVGCLIETWTESE